MKGGPSGTKKEDKEIKQNEKDEKPNKQKDDKEKENIISEKEKSGSFHENNKMFEMIKEKSHINRSIYVNSSNINKIKI